MGLRRLPFLAMHLGAITPEMIEMTSMSGDSIPFDFDEREGRLVLPEMPEDVLRIRIAFGTIKHRRRGPSRWSGRPCRSLAITENRNEKGSYS